jgi:hypothetical protein
MANEISAVLEFGAPAPGETATMMEDKLRFHTDSWDLAVDLKAALADIVVIDARSRDATVRLAAERARCRRQQAP